MKLESLILFERNETALFRAAHLAEQAPFPFHAYLGDVASPGDVREVLSRFRPQIVLHAAAYKHVHIAEEFPEKAFWNNTWATSLVAKESLRWGVKLFLLFSTDKAVEPAGVMGASKCLAERLALSLNSFGDTTFCVARFANVFGSSGSFLELLEHWLRNNEPVRLTHPEAKRYFIAEDEAVLLVLEAIKLSEPATMAVDAGRPVKISELIRRVAKLVGVEPKVVLVGLRPGEKVCEKLFWEWENPRLRNGILVADSELAVDLCEIERILNELSELARLRKRQALKRLMVEFASAL